MKDGIALEERLRAAANHFQRMASGSEPEIAFQDFAPELVELLSDAANAYEQARKFQDSWQTNSRSRRGVAGIRVLRSSRSGDRTAPYRVGIDGAEAGELWEGQCKYFAITPGAHTVQIKTLLIASNPLVVTPQHAQTIELSCRNRSPRKIPFWLHTRPQFDLDLHVATAEESQLMAKTGAEMMKAMTS